jgi:hypothetical protein
MKQFVRGLAVFAALAGPAHAASCAEGVQIVEQMTGTLDLSEAERLKIKALVAKAKTEDQQGHERSCKLILAGAIRFFLVRTVID